MDGLVFALVIIIISVLIAVVLLVVWNNNTTNNTGNDTTNNTGNDTVSGAKGSTNNTVTVSTMADNPREAPELEIYIINLERKPGRYSYVTSQLENLGMTKYQRWIGTDGFTASDAELLEMGVTKSLIKRGRGLAGCATSHVRLWKHIVQNNMDWTLILEDDAHFHPDFVTLFPKYWREVPKDAKIIFPGFCAPKEVEDENTEAVIPRGVMCLHGYMLNAAGAAYLLKELLPMDLPVDIPITEHFRHRAGSYIFNGNFVMDGIRPNDYKESNGKRCMFNGIIYQNQQDQGSTIHQMETVF